MKPFLLAKLVTACLVVVLLIPTASVNAAEADDTNQLLLAQLGAIMEYLDRLTPSEPGQLSHNELRQAIDDGVEWIINSQEENGHFRYEYVPYEGKYNDDDNIVRQAGALYALGEVYRHQTDKDPELAAAIENSIGYFENLAKESEKEHGDFACPVDPKNERDCRLGAISLALLGILSYVDNEPNKLSDYDDLINDYVSFILTAKKPETGFRDRYRVGTGWQTPESSFSNGEALLALVRHYQLEPREDVKAVIDAAYDYLAEQEFESGLYLWMMAALKDMNHLWPDDEYVIYAKSFTDWRVGMTTFRRGTDKNYCAYAEGVASAYSVLENRILSDEQTALREELRYWNDHNSTLQIHSTDLFRLTNYNDILKLSLLDNPAQAHGGFLTAHSNEVQRIDFTQHCVSAYLQTLVDIEGENL